MKQCRRSDVSSNQHRYTCRNAEGKDGSHRKNVGREMKYREDGR